MDSSLYQTIISTPILILQIVLAVLFACMVVGKDKAITIHFKKHGMVYGMIAATAALIGSIGFSEGFNYIPCKLCWVQRIFHFPHVILFAVALYHKDTNVWRYSLPLSIIGGSVAGYQVLLQFFPDLVKSSVCGIVPAAGNCSDILTQSYGYISIPVMSLTIFTSLIVLALYHMRKV